jgi:hypothetical protein
MIKVKGQWVYLDRAVDKRAARSTSSRRRDMAAAKRFFSRATKQHGTPRVITLDGYAASHQAVAKLKTSGILPRRVQVRSCSGVNASSNSDSPSLSGSERHGAATGDAKYITAIIAAVIASGGAAAFGMPAYFILRASKRTAFWITPVLGFAVGVATWLIFIVLFALSRGDSETFVWHNVANNAPHLQALAPTGGLGADAGVTLWLIGRPDRGRLVSDGSS